MRGNGKETEGIGGIVNPLYSFISFHFVSFQNWEDWQGKEKFLMSYLPISNFNPYLLTIY